MKTLYLGLKEGGNMDGAESARIYFSFERYDEKIECIIETWVKVLELAIKGIQPLAKILTLKEYNGNIEIITVQIAPSGSKLLRAIRECSPPMPHTFMISR